MHRCQHLVDPLKQFWNWFCGMAFRAAIVLLVINVIKMPSFQYSLYLWEQKKVIGGEIQ